MNSIALMLLPIYAWFPLNQTVASPLFYFVCCCRSLSTKRAMENRYNKWKTSNVMEICVLPLHVSCLQRRWLACWRKSGSTNNRIVVDWIYSFRSSHRICVIGLAFWSLRPIVKRWDDKRWKQTMSSFRDWNNWHMPSWTMNMWYHCCLRGPRNLHTYLPGECSVMMAVKINN